MTGDEALENLRQQITSAELGASKIIKCPYCGDILDFSPHVYSHVTQVVHENWSPPTCCAEFALAVIAILGRKEQDERKEFAERVMEKVSRN